MRDTTRVYSKWSNKNVGPYVEEEKVEDMIRTLADEVPLRDLLNTLVTEMREMRAQLNRIEAQLNAKQYEHQQFYYTGTTAII